MSHAHLDPLGTLELALARPDDPRRVRLSTCPECAEAIARAGREAAALRRRVELDPGEGRAEALVARVLAATTGAARRARTGGLAAVARRLLGSPGRRRLAAAAALLLAALPLLAWWLRTADRGGGWPIDGRAPAPASASAPADERTRAAPWRARGETVERALARDRLALDRALRAPDFQRVSAVRLPGEILACRVERWLGEPCGVRSPGQAASGIEAVLWAEILLDDLVRDARAGGELAALLSTCRRLAEGRGPEAELARHAVARAARYGILSGPQATSPAREAAPLDPSWFSALSTAVVAASAQDDPTVRAWLDYGGPARSGR